MWQEFKKNLKWWVRPGWLSILLWSAGFGLLFGLIVWLFGGRMYQEFGLVAGLVFFIVSVLIRDGDKF